MPKWDIAPKRCSQSQHGHFVLQMRLEKLKNFRLMHAFEIETFVDNEKVMAKGQITIPKDVRDVLGVASGDRVTFMVEGNSVRIANSAV